MFGRLSLRERMSESVESYRERSAGPGSSACARLARLLLDSLHAADDQHQVAAAWEAEVNRRVAEFRRGGIASVPASTVFGEARSRVTGG
jgi:hypothetical protein